MKHPQRHRSLLTGFACVAALVVSTAPAFADSVPPPPGAKFPTYDLDATGKLGPGLSSDIAGSAFTDADGQFHWTNGNASYEERDIGVSNNTTFTNTDMGAVSLGQTNGTTKEVKANNFYSTPGTLCYRLNDRKDAKGKRTMPSPYNDDHCDVIGVWVDPDTKKWYAAINDEFTFDPQTETPKPNPDRIKTSDHSNRLLVATSDDKGKSWEIVGPAITPPNEPAGYYRNKDYPGSTWSFAESGVRFFVDNNSGYFYLSYNYQVRLKSAPFTSVIQWNSTARAPISAKMAPGSWNKFYNGTWTQPGLGGLDGAINTPLGLSPLYTPKKDEVAWTGKGLDGSALRYTNHLVTSAAPTFAFADAAGKKYTADYRKQTITGADGKTVDKVEFTDPALGYTTLVEAAAVGADGKKALTITQTSPEGVKNVKTVGNNGTVYTDAKTGRIFLPKPLNQWALSYNTQAGKYQAYGYDGYVYQTDDLGAMNSWKPVGYADIKKPAYMTTLDHGSLTNQNITTRSFLSINDLYSTVTRITAKAPTAGQSEYTTEKVAKDTAGKAIAPGSGYTFKVGGKALTDGAKNTTWQVVPVKDEFDTAANSGVYRIRNLQTGQYLTLKGASKEAKRAWGAKSTAGPAEPGYDPKGNGGFGSGGGSDQWYLLPQSAAKPAVLGAKSSAKRIAAASNTSIGASTRYVLVNRSANAALTLGDDGQFSLQSIAHRDPAQLAKITARK